MRKKTVLLIEDDELFRKSLLTFLSENHQVFESPSESDALQLLERTSIDVVLLDITFAELDGRDLLKKIKGNWPEQAVIMLTAIDRIATVVECMKLGAFDYLAKPVNPDELLLAISRAAEATEIKQELNQRRKLQLVSNKEYRIIGTDPKTDEIRKQIQLVAPYDSAILIEGETGTGKELVARAIHAESSRASAPFVAINCGAIPRDLIETEFFGYKKGAFTGAVSNEIGKFSLANRGTLLLDEIGELPLEAQTKLLRVLEENEFYRIGGTELVKSDVRLIASTNRNLRHMVEEKTFREDLFYRLNVYSIRVPPLRERASDILPLVEYFLVRLNPRYNKEFHGISNDALKVLQEHSWPGNIRELRNLVERIVLAENAPEIAVEQLHILAPLRKQDQFRIPEQGLDLEQVEKDLIVQALKMSNGNRTKAAKLLNLTPPTLYYRLEKYGITS